MNSNDLLHYMRGFFELVPDPTPAQIRAIQLAVLQAKPVDVQYIPVEVVNPMKTVTNSKSGDCGCK